ncbi:uncharacterized protein [Argopecten irradians]|uniref:uncharacterized protein n=1 Tax=Argopecten irradians TaxID=31199 RepID=UPI00371E9DA9
MFTRTAQSQIPCKDRQMAKNMTTEEAIGITLQRQLLDEMEYRANTSNESTVKQLKSKLVAVLPDCNISFQNSLDLQHVFEILKQNNTSFINALERLCSIIIHVHPKCTEIVRMYCQYIKMSVTCEGNILSARLPINDTPLAEFSPGRLMSDNHQARLDSFLYFTPPEGHDIDNLVTLGYYPFGDGKGIRCCRCDVAKMTLNPGDNSLVYHGSSVAVCPNLRIKNDNKNQPVLLYPTAINKVKMKSSMLKREQIKKQRQITMYFNKVKRAKMMTVRRKQNAKSLRKRKHINKSNSTYTSSAYEPVVVNKKIKLGAAEQPSYDSISTLRCNQDTEDKNTASLKKGNENLHDRASMAKPECLCEDVSSTKVSASECFSNRDVTCEDNVEIETGLVSTCLEVHNASITTSRNTILADENTTEIQTSDIQDNPQRLVINPQYAEESARMATFRKWRSTEFVDTKSLVDAGLFYTGVEDSVRCFYCDVGFEKWDNEDNPWEAHARHSPDCSFLQKMKGAQYIADVQAEWSKIYSPMHPEFKTMQARVETYGSSWTSQDLKQSPEEMADAGFIYTGPADCVRCFYCGGDVWDWETTDVPWNEHARYFPFCKYLLNRKGIDFVIENDSSEDDFEDELMSSPTKEIGTIRGGSPFELEWGDGGIISGHIGISDVSSDVDILLDTMDYDEENGDSANCPQIEGMTHRENITEIPDKTDSNDVKDEDNDLLANTFETLQRENTLMKERATCKICCDGDIQLIFLPCGHLVACRQCGVAVTVCLICSATVQGTLKTVFDSE